MRAFLSLVPRRFPTAARVGVAFGIILVLFAVALMTVLRALHTEDLADAEAAHLDLAKHSAHRVAALARDQYVHQAHTIIYGNGSHLDHYNAFARAAAEAARELHDYASKDDERQLAVRISNLLREDDAQFKSEMVPAVERADTVTTRRLHGALEAHTTEIVGLIGALSQELEGRADAAREHANILRKRVRVLAICCFGAALAFACGLAVAITRRLAGRVSALRSGAKSLGNGNLSARVMLAGEDEFSELAQAFNDMASSLANKQSELLRSQKLASVGHVAAGVAHEINNPLGIILGYVKLMRRKPGIADDDGLRVIEEEAVQCQRVVQGLLDLARTPTLNPEPVDLGALTRDCVERLVASDRNGGVGIDAAKVQNGVNVYGDEMRLRQVVTNLLLNAVEASPQGQNVVVEVRREGAQVLLAVLDMGPGMSDETRAHVFEPFFTTKAQGTGLGLAVAYAVVDAHLGEIRLEPASAGGTRAVVLLPVMSELMASSETVRR